MARKKTKQEPHVQTQLSWINSRAYKALSPSAHKALPFFQAKVKIHLGNPQRYIETFTLSHGELKQATSMSDHTCSKAFHDLVRFGLIDPVKKGGLRGFGKTMSIYRLSKRWELYGRSGFHEIDLRQFGT